MATVTPGGASFWSRAGAHFGEAAWRLQTIDLTSLLVIPCCLFGVG